MRRGTSAAFAVAILLGGTARADGPPAQLTDQRGIQIDPVAIAAVRLDGRRIVAEGPWIPYTTFLEERSAPMHIPAFDCLGLPGGLGPLDPTTKYCPSPCDKGMVMNVPFPSPNTLEDAYAIHAPPSSLVSALVTAWYWNPSAPTRLIMIFIFFNEPIETCPNPARFTATGPGIAIDFGELPSSAPFFYNAYVLNTDTLGMRFPARDRTGDGHPDGSYQMILATGLSDSGPEFPLFPAYPLLAATGDATGQCRRGHNNPWSFDDASPPDGVFQPSECHDYSQDSCPTPLGKANAFFVRRCPADLNADGFVDGIDMDLFSRALETTQCLADFNGDCYVDGTDVDRFYNEYETICP